MSELASPKSLNSIVMGYGNGLKLECRAVQQREDQAEGVMSPLNF